MKRSLLFAILILCASVQVKSVFATDSDKETTVDVSLPEAPEGPIDIDW